MRQRREFRPTVFDRLEDRVVPSQAGLTPALVAAATTVQTQNQLYVQSLYAFAGLTPTTAGVAFHAQELTNGTLSRFQLSQVFLNTTSFRNVETRDLFSLLLNRAPSTAELNHFAQNNQGQTHSLVIEAAQIIGSQEYFNLAGGTNQGFITKAYRNIFARNVDSGAQHWINLLNNGVSRQQVALDLLNSPEGSTNLVEIAYEQTLLRAPDSGSQVYVRSLQNGGSYENVFASLLASPEFYAASQTRTFV